MTISMFSKRSSDGAEEEFDLSFVVSQKVKKGIVLIPDFIRHSVFSSASGFRPAPE